LSGGVNVETRNIDRDPRLNENAFEQYWFTPNVTPFPVDVGPPTAVKFAPFPDLSFHEVRAGTVPNVILVVSPPSNHKANPGIDWGENPHVFLDDDTIDVAIALLI